MTYFISAIAVIAITLFFFTLANVLSWRRIRPLNVQQGQFSKSISVLIPARNEAQTIERCVESALRQGDVIAEVLVYDDQSEDDTAERVRALYKKDQRVHLIAGIQLTPGWYGKPHACFQLAKHARAPWMLFLDADAVLEPNSASSMVNEAVNRNVTLLAFWPGIVLGSHVEKFLMPLLNFFVFTMFPTFFASRSNDERFGLAHGACMLFHRETYHRLGGHALVKNELFEDTVLTRLWRRNGERSLCVDGQNVVRVRMYSTLAEIWMGFKKNFYPGFRSGMMFWFFIAFHFTVFLLAFLLLPFTWQETIGIAAGIAVLAVLSIRFILALRFHYPLLPILFHPVAESFVIAIGIASWWKWKHGSGVTWKGRQYKSNADKNISARGTAL